MTVSEEQAWITQDTHNITFKSQLVDRLGHNVTDSQPEDALRAVTNCTVPYASVNVLINDNRDIVLTFSVLKDDDRRHLTLLTCHIHLTSDPGYVISAVLLEHSDCGGGGGVFVILRDSRQHRVWNVCSVWRAPGPDMVTASNVADVSVEMTDNVSPFELAVSVRAVQKPVKKKLEL